MNISKKLISTAIILIMLSCSEDKEIIETCDCILETIESGVRMVNGLPRTFVNISEEPFDDECSLDGFYVLNTRNLTKQIKCN